MLPKCGHRTLQSPTTERVLKSENEATPFPRRVLETQKDVTVGIGELDHLYISLL